MTLLKKIFLSILLYTLIAFGISLSAISAIGMSPLNALMLTLSQWTLVPLGTMTIGFNLFFLSAYFFLEKKRKPSALMLQLFIILAFGNLINLFLALLGGPLYLSPFYIKGTCYLLGTIISASALGGLLAIKGISFPLEALCQSLSNTTGLPFIFFRYAMDLSFAASALALTLKYDLPLNLREGTLISCLLFSFFINISKKLLTAWGVPS